MSFRIKQNDLLPSLEAVLRSTAPFSLADAVSVAFVYRKKNGGARVERVASVADADTNRVRYDWEAEDTEALGTYEAQFEVTFPPGKVMTFPSVGFITFEVVETI